jgi:hypothetical protein
MKVKFLRKFLVVLIMTMPVFANTDCKKQPKCGCDGDALFTLDETPATVYWQNNETIWFMTDAYSTYYFCNPGEMYSKLADSKSGDVLRVSGEVFWDCSYLYQQSNYSYGAYNKVYQVRVTDVHADMYGKK